MNNTDFDVFSEYLKEQPSPNNKYQSFVMDFVLPIAKIYNEEPLKGRFLLMGLVCSILLWRNDTASEALQDFRSYAESCEEYIKHVDEIITKKGVC